MPMENPVSYWLPPEAGVYKANCDVKRDKLGGRIAVLVLGLLFGTVRQATPEANVVIFLKIPGGLGIRITARKFDLNAATPFQTSDILNLQPVVLKIRTLLKWAKFY
ncbi:hypothetical protein LWI29_022822 [Acer saccharum]|uniref:Uncharacterized protein n=1 Tax=Acer saccharum TaxID=4024 RepID=A0AA39UVA6_ACESA|nr:hypothetical protein LWI29_022822 [Acer saccharum]